MSSSLQTIIALIVVGLAAGWLIFSVIRKKPSGCGSEGCSAVSSEVKKLKAKLKH